MSGIEWCVVALATVCAVVLIVRFEITRITLDRTAERTHEANLALAEERMFMAALKQPPINMFQQRGRPIPRFVSKPTGRQAQAYVTRDAEPDKSPPDPAATPFDQEAGGGDTDAPGPTTAPVAPTTDITPEPDA